MVRKDPLKLKYKKTIELALIGSLIIHSGVFTAFKQFDEQKMILDEPDVTIEVQDIPQTEQVKRPPPPARPAIPIESESEDILDDVTIEDTEIDFSETPPPPPPPAEEEEASPIFFAWDEDPEPIGGYDAIWKRLKYPEIARKAGVEGQVIIQATIDENGNVIDCTVLKSLGNNGTSEAAIEAIQGVKWKPAKQRDRTVKVRISIPVRFQIK